jgi:CRP-like cAMP-binding protein
MVKQPGPPARSRSNPAHTDGDGNHVANKILLRLPPAEFERVLPKLEFVRLKLHQIVHEAGETMKPGYFLNSGVISVLAVQPDGKSVEVGLIGREGFCGVPLVVGYHTSPTRTVTQADATAYRCGAEVLSALGPQCPELLRQLHRFSQRLAMQTTQIAACNRLHDVEERLASFCLETRILAKNLNGQ